MRDLAELKINFGGRPIDHPPPTDEVVRAFEARFEVKLPEDYLVLLRCANGGHPVPGPGSDVIEGRTWLME